MKNVVIVVGLLSFVIFVLAVLISSLVDSLHDKQLIDYDRYDCSMKIINVIGVAAFIIAIVASVLGFVI